MNSDDGKYILAPTAFHSMREAQELADSLDAVVQEQGMGTAGVGRQLVAIFSRLIANAAEHRMSPAVNHAHVRFMPHRRGHAFDCVVADSGPGIRATLERNPNLPDIDTDVDAIALAVQELVSGTDVPTRGAGLWTTVNEMKKPGRKVLLHSGAGLLTMYGTAEPELREVEYRQGTVARLTIPA